MKNPVYSSSKLLRSARYNLGLPLLDLSNGSGFSVSTIISLENGSRFPGRADFLRLSALLRCLNIDLAYFLDLCQIDAQAETDAAIEEEAAEMYYQWLEFQEYENG